MEESFKQLKQVEEVERLMSLRNERVYKDPLRPYTENRVMLPSFYAQFAEEIENFQIVDTDVIICSFPKSGTHWMKELVWLVLNKGDVEKSQEETDSRSPYFERDGIWSQEICEKLGWKSSLKMTAALEHPRLIRSHLPWELFPSVVRDGRVKPKIIYVARNPKDVCVSWYHHYVLFFGYKGTLKDSVDEFVNDLTLYAPFWKHVESFWRLRLDDNVLFLAYEDMVKNLSSIVKTVAQFLNVVIPSERMPEVLKYLSFDQMKLNPHTNRDAAAEKLIQIHGVQRKTNFIRKGKAGSWKEELDEECIKKLDQWNVKNGIASLLAKLED